MSCFNNGGLWTDRIFYDDFSNKNWQEQFNIDVSNDAASCCRENTSITYNSYSSVIASDFLTLDVDPVNYNTTFSSSVQSIVNDIVYGSFRVYAKVKANGGTNFGISISNSSLSGIDIEVLSNERNTVRNMVKPYIKNSMIINSTNSRSIYTDTSNFVEYRVDWLKDRVDFYIDGVFYNSLKDYNGNVPNKPSKVILFHKSNGNPLWSKGPPDIRSSVDVKYVDFYFNKTINYGCQEESPERFKNAGLTGIILASIGGAAIIITAAVKLYNKYKTIPIDPTIVAEDILVFLDDVADVVKDVDDKINHNSTKDKINILQMEDVYFTGGSVYSDIGEQSNNDIGSRRP
jgi:hypothetical protein